jgi:hypothetical protein
VSRNLHYIFLFQTWTPLVRIMNFLSICKISHSDLSMFPLCYISPEWAVSGIMWNIEKVWFSWGQSTEVDSFHSWSSKDLFSLPGGQPRHQHSHFRQCSLPPASTSVIPTVAFNASLIVQCCQNFSNLRYKSKMKQLHDKWIRAMSYLFLEGSAFFFSFSFKQMRVK